MSKYSYLLPTKTYKEIGPYRLLELGSLKRGEVIELSQIQKRTSRQMVAGLNLADKISKTKGISIDAALECLQNIGTPESASIMAEFAGDLAAMMDQELTAEELDAELVSVFMRSRAEAQLEEGCWTRLQDWSTEDTAELPEELFTAIVSFIEHERGMDAEEPAGNDPKPGRRRKASSTTETA